MWKEKEENNRKDFQKTTLGWYQDIVKYPKIFLIT